VGHLKPVSEIMLDRAKRDPKFRVALLGQAIECFIENDVQTAKKMIRNYVLASMGFEKLAKTVDKKPESLMRMLSDKGNPTMNNVAALLASLKKYEGIDFHVEAVR
jgi:DNA-binding phage protein